MCAGLVAYLLLASGNNQRSGSRRHGTTQEGGALQEDAAAADEGSSGAEAGGASGAGARDDDPNRVPGADLVLRGQVVRDGTGVEGATVVALRSLPHGEYSATRWAMMSFELPPPPIATTLSDDGGRFELRIPRRTRVILRAAKPGSGSASLFLLMPATGDPADVLLRLRPGGKVEGIVVDEKAAPVKGADVVLGTQDWSRPVTEMSARTDEEGRFVLEDVPDGGYRLRATAASYPEARSWVNVPLQKFVRIEMRPAGIITGNVVDGRGNAVAGARILLSTSAWERDAAGGAAKGETDDRGAYRLEIYPGSVQTAVVEHPTFGRQVAGPESFDLPTGLVETGKELKYDIRLKRGVPVHGRVVYEGKDTPAAGASVSLLRMAQQWRGMNEADSVRADEDGRFEFVYVTEGTYGLEAKADAGARLATRYAQGNQRMTIDFFVDGETSPPEQRLELVATGGVRGRILGIGEPDPNQRPNIYLQVQTTYLSATVDDLGAFELLHVPAMEDAVLQSNNPQAKSDPFRVEAGKVAEVNLDASKQGITGVVEDDAGRPVARARVQMCPHPQLQQQLQQFVQGRGWGGALTDEQGRFTITTAAQWGDWYKSQKFVAFANREGYVVALGEPFDLPQEGSPAPTLRLVLRTGGSIRGRVEHVGGAPGVGVAVTISPKPDPNAQQQQQRPDPGAPPDTRSSQWTYSDHDGRFELRGVGEGLYVAIASDPQGKVEPRDARAGDEGVKLVIEPALAIAGVVVTEGGRPVSGAQVSVLVPKERGEQPQMGQTQANGRFRIGQLAAGAYPVEVSPSAQGWGAVASFEKKRVEGVTAGTEDVVIVVSEGKSLKGRVEDGAGKPVPGAGVIAMTLAAPPPPQQPARPRQMPQQSSQPSAVANGRGEFEFKGVGSAEVELLVVADGFTPATQRAVAGGAPVTIRLEGGAVIEGRIFRSDGTPVARQWLWLQPMTKETQERLQDWQQRGGQAWNYLGGQNTQSGSTDAEGRFRFASLLPGEYRIHAQFGDEILPQTTLRTGMPSATLRLERALTVRGRVLGPDGQPAALQGGNPIYVNARKGEQWFSGTTVGSDGRFELRGLPAGTVTLQTWGGNEYKQATVDVVAGSDGVTITLERAEPKPIAK